MSVRRALLGGLALLAVLGVTLGSPLGARAHALRVASSPDADALLQAPPTQVSITFGEQPDPRISSIQVLDTGGHDHTSGRVQSAPGDARTLVVPVGKLADGVYTVAWRTLSAVDGHRAAGSFAFGAGVSAAQLAGASAGAQGGSVTDTSPPPSPLAVAGRWLLFAGLIALVGAALVGSLVLVTLPGAVVVQALGGAVTAAVGTAMVVTAQAQDAGLGLGDLVSSSIGHAVLERVITAVTALTLALLAVRLHGGPRRMALLGAGAAAALAMLADVGNSHAAAGSWTTATVVLQWMHILAVGYWIGGLAALLLALRGSPSEDRTRAARRFSTGAGIALVVVLATGTIRAAVAIGSWGSVLSTSFGRIVLVKVGLITVLAGLGAVNRWRNLDRAPRALSGLRRVGSVELGVAAAAVLAAALLVNVAPPASAQATGPTGPPPLQPLTLTASDFATTVTVQLSVTPATAGFNTFTARVLDYDSGAVATGVSGVQLDFTLTQRPDIGGSNLRLASASDGNWTARGGNLSLDGVWSVTALVERGAASQDVSFTVPTRSTQKVDVSAVPGQPTLYTVHLDGGLKVQWYLDPQTAGHDTVHSTFFDAAGNGYPAAHGSLSSLPSGGTLVALPTRELEPGHYVGDGTLVAGRYRFDVIATGTDGRPVSAHIDITVG
jgi:copper transport protein